MLNMKNLNVLVYVSMLMGIDVEMIGVVDGSVMDMINDDVSKRYKGKDVEIKRDEELSYELWVDGIYVGWYEKVLYRKVK